MQRRPALEADPAARAQAPSCAATQPHPQVPRPGHPRPTAPGSRQDPLPCPCTCTPATPRRDCLAPPSAEPQARNPGSRTKLTALPFLDARN
ncbi:uncharacterized protein LOC100278803 [Zea mays]|uniref:Uncharacterized protein n=1 Tax=Zea mays TaxID=4577 RepID=B6UDV7_MAIZE|nr:uncharacterized protein LOC100278803 [Zea mays]ACG47540.1 hypothetical protein [Zea mays]|eukprot:NP_001145432.1 uncharacterized protein LOC100278803 [Zea mays]